MKGIYAVRDKPAEMYLSLHVAVAAAVAMRGFSDECHRKDSVMGAHPEDFELHCLGEFDEGKGTLVSYERPMMVLAASDVIRKAPESRDVPAVVNGADKKWARQLSIEDEIGHG